MPRAYPVPSSAQTGCRFACVLIARVLNARVLNAHVLNAHVLILNALAIGALLGAVIMPVLPVYAQSADILRDEAGGAYEGVEVALQASGASAPGGSVLLDFSATPLRNAPDLTVTWDLPDGGVLLDGPPVAALGVVAPGQTVTQTRHVRFPDAGVYTVRTQATYHPDAATTLTAVGVLFFTVAPGGALDGAAVSDGDPRWTTYTPPARRPTVDKAGLVVAAETWGVNAPQGCFYVTGILTRGERQPAANPPRYIDVGGSAVPVHNMLVEMREEDTISDDSYGFTVTDANGKFEFRFCDDDGVLNDELELYTRVCAEVWEGPIRIARIEDPGEQELYCFDSPIMSSEGGTVDFDVTAYGINSLEAPIFNIADSIYWDWKYWNSNLGSGAPFFDRGVTVYWARGAKAKGSFYSATRTTMVIADDASSADEWDDSVIMHEWGHFADHQFSCNQNPGGAHTLPGFNNGTNGDKLSWGEGYPDYYQSAARTLMPGSGFTSYYIDVSGPTVDFEVLPGAASPLNEGAIAALLWDFLDSVNDGSDTVSHGQARIQKVYTDPGFQANGQCNMARFLTVWKDLAFPTDAATAATVVQNVQIAKPFGVAVAASAVDRVPVTAADSQALAAATPLGYRWWDQVTMVVDNSASMAGPGATPKLDATKALIREQVNDLSAHPQGTEFDLYTFNAGSGNNSVLGEGKFYANQIDPLLTGLTAAGADTGCGVYGLEALTQAAQDKYDGQAWLYTDGDSVSATSTAYFQQQLNDRLVHGSVVLLGGCNALPTVQSNVTGGEKSYLGLAADGSQPSGIVPYLLTAIGTGGQFLYVAPDQLANAVDILRAQASHSAGAGRWSDYVSTRFTYRWDRLTPGEYQWMPSGLLQDRGQLASATPVRVNLPQQFNVFGVSTGTMDVYEDGYIHLSPCLGNPELCPFFSQYANVLNKDLVWTDVIPGPNAAAAPTQSDENGPQVHVYQGGLGIDEWHIISTEGLANYGNGDLGRRAYQVWLNYQTGEIRYLYDAVRSVDTAAAKISVTSQSLFSANEVVVSNQDLAGAVSGGGYKFTPAPPQPSKSYPVTIDSQIQSMGFLQTGYSGSLAPMRVVDPAGTPVDCGDSANVLCLSLNNGLLQYVQVNVNGKTGIWTATVAVGATGEGTFSFNALAASPLRATGLGKRTLSLSPQTFTVDLGRRTDDGLLAGWLQTATGASFGSTFALFDDGNHADGAPGDGVFGSDIFTPPGSGVAYLWTSATVGGEPITRSDPTPYNFQPVDVQPETPYVQGFLGSSLNISFAVTNQETVQRCFYWQIAVPMGWNFEGSSGSPFCIPAGGTAHPSATFSHPLDDRQGGVTSELGATFFEAEEARIVGGAAVTAAFFRPLTSVAFDNRFGAISLRPNGTDAVDLIVNLLDDQGQISGWSGALGYQLSTTLGVVTSSTATSPTDGRFENGRLPIHFTSGSQTGEALITFVLEGDVTATTTLTIRNPAAAEITLRATPQELPLGIDSSTLVATVRDLWGDPVAGQLVRFSVSDDDGSQGTLDGGEVGGGEVVTGTTDLNGDVEARFHKGLHADGTVAVRAETVVADGTSQRVTHEAVLNLTLASAPSLPDRSLYLPFLLR